MKKTILAASAALTLLSCGVTTNYIGKRYPATEAPEIYAAWEDVPCAYETMGRIEAEPRMFKTLEDAQTAIERRARETGADAIVFTGIRRLVQEPTRTSTGGDRARHQGQRNPHAHRIRGVAHHRTPRSDLHKIQKITT